MAVDKNTFVVLGGGVVGLTTAYELANRVPGSKITVVAKHFPGDVSPKEYCSPQAGANWVSFETEYNKQAKYDEITFKRFQGVMRDHPECGAKTMPLRLIYGNDTPKSARPWYTELLNLHEVPKEDIPETAGWGLEGLSFIINTAIYLGWLQGQCLRKGVKFVRRHYKDIDSLIADFPNASGVFNCTGLGAHSLGGVKDHNVYPAKGQTLLLEDSPGDMEVMSIWSQETMGPNEFAHVFPRPLGGGIIIGGVKLDGDWSDTVDPRRAKVIKERACRLSPGLGKPEDLQVVRHNTGLRPARKGGVRVEAEKRGERLIVHNYGHGGSGYQSSWGTAEHAVDLLLVQSGLNAKSKL